MPEEQFLHFILPPKQQGLCPRERLLGTTTAGLLVVILIHSPTGADLGGMHRQTAHLPATAGEDLVPRGQTQCLLYHVNLE